MSILTTAEEIINGQRAIDYGDARDNHQRIADFWSVYLQRSPEDSLTPEDVATMMVLMKVARLMNGYHIDSVVDIAGYAGVLEKIQLPKELRYLTPNAPRVWQTVEEIPVGVREVIDRDGDHLFFNEHGDARYFSADGGRFYTRDNFSDHFAPFTEVV